MLVFNKVTQKYDKLDIDKRTSTPVDQMFPTKRGEFNETIAAEIIDRVANGKTMTSIIDDPDMPGATTILSWRKMFPEFDEMLKDARSLRAERYHDGVHQIAIDAPSLMKDQINGAKVSLDALKWLAEKNDPKTFGKKEDVANGGISVTIDLGLDRIYGQSLQDIEIQPDGTLKEFNHGKAISGGVQSSGTIQETWAVQGNETITEGSEELTEEGKSFVNERFAERELVI
jgi:hypothetical protein